MANPTPAIRLLLARYAETAWHEVIRPWLEEGRNQLKRCSVVVPTRGQAHGLKRRCLAEGLALMGVEFLSPGLARQKWVPMIKPPVPVLGRELLLLGLRAAIERRLRNLPTTDLRWGWWKSLQSDPGGALDVFDDLLRAGFRAENFPVAPLREIFTELTEWVEAHGYELGPRQTEVAALRPIPPDAPRLGGRLLVYGMGAEMWGEFFNVTALVRRFNDITVVLPEPEFRGRKALDERWIEIWEALLGISALPLSDEGESPPPSCEAVGALWGVTGKSLLEENLGPERSREARVRLLVGRTRKDEMRLVADEIVRLLARAADNLAVIFPKADAAHLELAELLAEREVLFTDLLESVGALPVDVQLQRALLAFYERGARLEEFLALWPHFRALGYTELPLGEARDVCERLFNDRQSHALSIYRERLESSRKAAWREVGRVAGLLLPTWPDELTLVEALARFDAVCGAFGLSAPAGWGALVAFADRERQAFPLKVVLTTLDTFLPVASPLPNVRGKGVFSRVTLTTRRRAERMTWSHLILVEANAGVWPLRSRPSCWLTDEQREELNLASRFSLGVLTSDDRGALEKAGYAALARDTQEEVIFSAALHDECDPETKLTPNSWVERVLWQTGALIGEGGFEAAFEKRSRTFAPAPETNLAETNSWFEIWLGRRDPTRPFDEFFLSVDPRLIRPDRLAARAIERAICDPAELWFEAILQAKQIDWTPLRRARKKTLGSLAHRVLAASLRGTPVEGPFAEKSDLTAATRKMAEELATWRMGWPQDRYWDSFYAELSHVCASLLAGLFSIESGRFVATEVWLPDGAFVPLGPDGERLAVYGRIDLALLDRPGWGDARVDLVDFKTGADAKLSAERMARDGSSLQLGIYLAAVASLGAAKGKIWMLRPDDEEKLFLEMDELPLALAQLEQLGRHLRSGRYGALTPDRSDYAAGGFSWPLACTPIPEAILRQKYFSTFETIQRKEKLDDE